MIFDWYKIINKTEFEALDIPSRELSLALEGVGTVTILVTKGNYISLLYDGVFLSVGMSDDNPFIFEGYAVYLDSNNDIYLGIENED